MKIEPQKVYEDLGLSMLAAGRSKEELKEWADHVEGTNSQKEFAAGVLLGNKASVMRAKVFRVIAHGVTYYFVGKSEILRKRITGEAKWPKRR